jgi:hypothetical protein
MVQQPDLGLGRLIIAVSRSRTVRHAHCVGVAEAQHTTDEHPYPQRDSNP